MNEYTPSKSTTTKLEALVSATVTVDSSVIEAARVARAEIAQKAAVEQAKRELEEIERSRNSAVQELKDYRRYAKDKEVVLGKLVDAETAYGKTGDFAAYSKARREAGAY